MRAFYNITNNRLSLWPDTPKGTKLPDDQKARVKAAYLGAWWPRGCYTGLWTPEGEDLLLELVGTITNDDTPDDVVARNQRHEKYAENAEQSAEQAKDRVSSGRAHTHRQLSQAEGTFKNASEKAAHWHSRIAGSIRLAAYKDKPDVIVRRIQGLEKDLRKWAKYVTRAGNFHGEAGITRASRWITHITLRLQYENEYLNAVGGDPRLAIATVEIGDTVLYNGRNCVVKSVGKVNLLISDPQEHWNGYGRRVGREKITMIVEKADPATIAKMKVDDGIKKGIKVKFDYGNVSNIVGTVISLGPKNCRVSTENMGEWYRKNYEFVPIRRNRLTLLES